MKKEIISVFLSSFPLLNSGKSQADKRRHFKNANLRRDKPQPASRPMGWRQSSQEVGGGGGKGAGCRELLALLKWLALPARKGQLCTNRNRVERKQEVLLKFKTICACPHYKRDTSRAALALPEHHLRSPHPFLSSLRLMSTPRRQEGKPRC